MTIVNFVPKVKIVDTLDVRTLPMELIRDEIMLFSTQPDFAMSNGGPITKHVLAKLGKLMPSGQNWVIDTRVHMLMKGQYPAIPGWHCDAVPRGSNGQPDFTKVNLSAPHYTVVVSTDKDGVSNPEYMSREHKVDIPDGVPTWNAVHNTIEESGDNIIQKDGDIVKFDQMTLHRASPAKCNGWRFFFRASLYHRPPRNEIRRQVQVYADPGLGW